MVIPEKTQIQAVLFLVSKYLPTFIMEMSGLYMIGYRTGKNILKFLPFCQLNKEYQERENSK